MLSSERFLVQSQIFLSSCSASIDLTPVCVLTDIAYVKVLHTKLMYKKMSFSLEKCVTYLGKGNGGRLGTEGTSSALGPSVKV